MVEVVAEHVALIAACLLPLAFLLSQQWRRSSERHRAIRQLLQLASEEAARAEFEAWIGPVEALILFILWMLPLVAFLIHRHWQESAERSRRIEQLREQASVGYTMHSPPYYLCPVCCRAATLICSGCRAFGYCSRVSEHSLAQWPQPTMPVLQVRVSGFG